MSHEIAFRAGDEKIAPLRIVWVGKNLTFLISSKKKKTEKILEKRFVKYVYTGRTNSVPLGTQTNRRP